MINNINDKNRFLISYAFTVPHAYNNTPKISKTCKNKSDNVSKALSNIYITIRFLYPHSNKNKDFFISYEFKSSFFLINLFLLSAFCFLFCFLHLFQLAKLFRKP